MSKLRKTINDDKVYGAPWAEFFISIILAKIEQAVWFPNAWMLFLLPLTWLLVHALIGNWLRQHSKGDIFGRDD